MKHLQQVLLLFLAHFVALSFENEAKWSNSTHYMIFVGGTHASGSSVVERLLSSQSQASGIEITDSTMLPRQDSCRQPSKGKTPTCHIEDHEGCFVTKQFDKLSSELHGEQLCRGGTYSIGDWVATFRDRFINAHSQKLGPDRMYEVREQLIKDWGLGWDFSKKYLVEKDIENAVRSIFLQEMFGRNRTAFVFVLRHPMGGCKHFKCSVEDTMMGWLNLYETMERDLEDLENYIVIHSEALATAPEKVVAALEQLLGWSGLVYNKSVGPRQLNSNSSDVISEDRGLSSATDIVTLSQTEGTAKWNQSYYQELMADKDILFMMRFYEERIKHFCYGIYDWNIHCDSPIFRMKMGVKWDSNLK